MSDYQPFDDQNPKKPRAPPSKSAKKTSAPGKAPVPAKGRGRAGGTRETGGASAGGERRLEITTVQKVDLSELATEEEIQKEKLRDAAEIQEGVRDIKGCYDEFSVLLNHQQAGIDRSAKNVETSVTNVQSGTEQLKQAGEHQKTSRKTMCCLVVVLVVVIIVVVIVLVLMRKSL